MTQEQRLFVVVGLLLIINVPFIAMRGGFVHYVIVSVLELAVVGLLWLIADWIAKGK